MRNLIQKKYIVAAIAAIIVIAGAVTWLKILFADRDEPLPTYDSNIETIVAGRFANEFTDKDLEDLNNLTRELGRLIYDVDEDYYPANISDYMMHTTARSLQSIMASRGVNSVMLSSGVLDVVMDDPDEGDALIYYLIDFESSKIQRGHYYMVASLQFIRTATGLMGYSVDAEDSAGTDEYELIRDSITGQIGFNYIG